MLFIGAAISLFFIVSALTVDFNLNVVLYNFLGQALSNIKQIALPILQWELRWESLKI
jgi:hypothetical protein